MTVLDNSTAFVPYSSTYIGNDAANRAIAHYLNRLPRYIFIWSDSATYIFHALYDTRLACFMVNVPYTALVAVTGWNIVFFFVGDGANAYSANSLGVEYRYVAI